MIKEIFFISVNYDDNVHALNLYNSLLKLEIKFIFVLIENGSIQQNYLNLSKKKNFYYIKNKINNYSNAINTGLRFVKNKYPEIKYGFIGNNDIILKKFKIYKKYENFFLNAPYILPNVYKNKIQFNPPKKEKLKLLKIKTYILFLVGRRFITYKIFFKIRKLLKKFVKPKQIKSNEIKSVKFTYGAVYFLTPQFFKIVKNYPVNKNNMGDETMLMISQIKKNFKIYYYPYISFYNVQSVSMNKLSEKKKYKIFKKAYFDLSKSLWNITN